MNLRTRVCGLAAAVGLLSGALGATAPAAHAVVVGGCSGLQVLGRFVPPLPSGGGANPVTAVRRPLPPGTQVWAAGFSSFQTVTAGDTCQFETSVFTDIQPRFSLAGTASCDSASTDPSLYPLNGELDLRHLSGGRFALAYIRVAGYDPVPGPDIVTITGIIVKGLGLGATVSGELFLDPVIRASINDPNNIQQGNLYFDNSQIALPCSSGGLSIDRFYLGDGVSLLGSIATGLTINL